MKIVDLNFEMTTAKGVVLDNKASDSLASFLESAVLKDEPKIVKYFNWSRLLSTGGILELDEGDMIELRKFVKDHDGMIVLVKRPILDAFDHAVEKGKKDKS